MIRNKLQFPLYFLLLLLAIPVKADTSVWVIEKNGQKLYLGGTVHFLAPADYPLPASFENAYHDSSQVVLETDFQKLQSPEFQQFMLRELSYPAGQNLKQMLSKDTYSAVEAFFSSRGIPMVGMNQFKAGMVAMTMTVVELQHLGLAGAGVDQYFMVQSMSDQKTLGKLETVEAQLEFIKGLGVGWEDEMFEYALDDIDRIPTLFPSLKKAWRNGDMKELAILGVDPLLKEFPEMYQSLIVDRNNAWMPQIESMLKTSEIELVLVGAAHLAGNDGLLAQLESRNYKITQLP